MGELAHPGLEVHGRPEAELAWETEDALRRAAEPTRFEAALAEGEAMSLDEAVEYALRASW